MLSDNDKQILIRCKYAATAFMSNCNCDSFFKMVIDQSSDYMLCYFVLISVVNLVFYTQSRIERIFEIVIYL